MSEPVEILEDPSVQLMLRVRNGDAQAMRELVVRWQKPLINFFYRSVNSVHTAEDLAQATFVKIYRAAGTYEPKAHFSSWLFLVARSILVSNFRKESARPVTATAPEEMPAVADARDELAVNDLERAFADAVRKLPENHRTAILLLRQQQLSYEEIAETMGASVQSVKTWIFRARQSLREMLSAYL